MIVHNQNYTQKWIVKFRDTFNTSDNNKITDFMKIHNFDTYQKIDGIYDHLIFSRKSRVKRNLISKISNNYNLEVEIFQQEMVVERFKRNAIIDMKKPDPYYSLQWYLHENSKININVNDVWKLGYTGNRIVVSILDDGIEHNHSDLSPNFDFYASWDVNDSDPDPFPRYLDSNENKHGTRCAGQVSAVAGNGKCGVGVAYNSRIGGVRMLDGQITDSTEAQALSINQTYIDIYSASWGPNDDGKTVEGPGFLALSALRNGILKGRKGKGSIYVWASGNGGHKEDNCNCDGYANSIYTLTVSSCDEFGESPWYSELCAATLTTAPSSGTHGLRKIVTTDLYDGCTNYHTGTSASAPIVAGVVALALEANNNLTWRDVQHLVVWSSNWVPLSSDELWQKNSVGLYFNPKFGFGLIDAMKLVKMSINFINVPIQKLCIDKTRYINKKFVNKYISIAMKTDSCFGTPNSVLYLEHVLLNINLKYSKRGELEIILYSPSGTKSQILSPRPEDDSNEGFSWTFTTVHFWGESPVGTWVIVLNDSSNADRSNEGILYSVQLKLYGTFECPSHQLKLSNISA